MKNERLIEIEKEIKEIQAYHARRKISLLKEMREIHCMCFNEEAVSEIEKEIDILQKSLD